MGEVLKALQELTVCWKKIGHYNMKCRWLPPIPMDKQEQFTSPSLGLSMQEGSFPNDGMDHGTTDGRDAIKFEIQVYCSSFLLHVAIKFDWCVLFEPFILLCVGRQESFYLKLEFKLPIMQLVDIRNIAIIYSKFSFHYVSKASSHATLKMSMFYSELSFYLQSCKFKLSKIGR